RSSGGTSRDTVRGLRGLCPGSRREPEFYEDRDRNDSSFNPLASSWNGGHSIKADAKPSSPDDKLNEMAAFSLVVNSDARRGSPGIHDGALSAGFGAKALTPRGPPTTSCCPLTWQKAKRCTRSSGAPPWKRR